MTRTTSYSEVQSFNSCGVQHYYSYGLNLTGKYLAEPLERGVVIHAALATYYQELKDGSSHDEAVSRAYLFLAGETQRSEAYDAKKLVMECVTLCSMYFKNYENEKLEVLAVETEFSIPIYDDYELPVRVDLIVRRNGRVECWDHKVIKDFFNDTKVDLAPQLRLYLAGLKTAGYKIDDLYYNEIRHRATIENKADPAQRFRRTKVNLTTASVVRTVEEHIMSANRIAAWKEMSPEEWKAKAIRNTQACNMCSFQALCVADFNGQDTSLLIEYEYKKKTKRIELNR